MRKVKGDYGRSIPRLNLEQAYSRRGKPDPEGVEQPKVAPVKTGRAIRPEDIPGYVTPKPSQE
jgi:hypothetical protein